MPRVSVIVATYNRPGLLREALATVSQQIFSDFEIVVVDDGSNVAGADSVCAGFSKCRYVFQENSGQPSARNRGIEQAQGQLIAFVDDDDLWKPAKLARQVAFLDQNPEVGLVHSPVEMILADGRRTGRILGQDKPEARRGSVFRHAVRTCVVKSPTPLVRREVFDRCGKFDENLSAGEDWELWARVAYRFEFGYIQEPLAYYRVHKGQYTKEEAYLAACPYIMQKLCAYVEPQDREIVRQEIAFAYLGGVSLHTKPRSMIRVVHLCRIVRMYPQSVGWRGFWGTLISAPKTRSYGLPLNEDASIQE